MIRRSLLGLAAGVLAAACAAGCGDDRPDQGVPADPLPVPDKKDRNKMAADRDGETPTSVKRTAFEGN
ncbi:MAG: hypothetical protein K2X87_00535 [Gemmataceae bacterium]|nr:hypothetical protein [Gemmataceae bacterium]